MKEAFENLQNAEVEPREKIKVTKADIVVALPLGKPYFNIHYREVGNDYDNIGFGSYDLNNVIRWREEEMEIVSEVEAEYGNGCEKQTYEICLNGCDDDTIFQMELTENEYQFLLRVSELANKTSTYGCMPRLYVKEYTPTTD